MNTVLMTGITGFLGSQIAQKLAQRADVAIYAVVRSRGNQTPQQRLERLFHTDPVLTAALQDDRIKPLAGDITQHLLGLSANDPALAEHIAAAINLIREDEATASSDISTAIQQQRTISLAMCQTMQDYVRDYLSDFFR